MEYFKISYKDKKEIVRTANEAKSKILASGLKYKEDHPEIIFTVGGDGTFLNTIQANLDYDPLYISINKGNLGYLCEFNEDEIELALKEFKDPKIKEIPLIELTYLGKKYYAVNEIRIESIKGKSFKFDVDVDNEHLETLKGDGAVIASSIGSSALARSLGGALIDNDLEILELVEKAPIDNKVYRSIKAPIVFSKEKVFTISNIDDEFALIFDTKYIEFPKSNEKMTIKLSSKKIRILKHPLTNYVTKTRSTFLCS